MDKTFGIAKEQARDKTFDVMRGMCVLAMTVHHCINYFPGYSLFYWRFVSGVFPFLAGYLVTSVLVGMATAVPDRNHLGWRLLLRGLKLIALCVVLNATLVFLLPVGHKGKLMSVFGLLENVALFGDYKSVSFSLLVPIGYTIALGGALLLLRMMRPTVILILGLALFGYCTLAEEFIGRKEYYLIFLSIGVFGMAAGYASDWISRTVLSTPWYTVAPWLVMQVVITALGRSEIYPIYCANTMASLLLIGFVAQSGINRRVDFRWLILLGQYSLLLYLAQIATVVALQVTFRELAPGAGLTGFWFAILFVGFAQLLIAAGTDRLRKWNPFSDRVYGWVFR